ncbi:MAG: hypothetical protein RL885_22525 [Planctomycetota bacterium]
MAWFKKPVAYRSYSDGTYEIIERRSLLPIYAVALAVAATLTGGPFILKSPPPIGPGSDTGRDPNVTSQIMVRIIQTRDTEAVYRILPHYANLDRIERYCFWNSARSLNMHELARFAKTVISSENDETNRGIMAGLIKAAER